MATILSKDVIRESTVQHDGREIIVTLSKEQEITMKLKGMKSGTVKISIRDLYNQCIGGGETSGEPVQPKEVKRESISIKQNSNDSPKNILKAVASDIRSHNAISNAGIEIVSQLDGVIKSVMDRYSAE